MTTLSQPGSLEDWLKTRKAIEAAITGVIGKLPSARVDLQVKIIDEQDLFGIRRRRVNYFLDDWTRVTAWMFVPEDAMELPAIVCMHGMNAMGKDETAGLEGGDPKLAFARHFAERGYVTIAPDTIAAGERTYSKLDPFDTKAFYKEHPKLSAIGKMLYDHQRAIDVLADAKEVDSTRVGAIGHDLGGVNALFLAAFDERIGATVSSCGITALSEDEHPERWAAESGMVLMPKLRAAIESGEYPFDWDELLALIAPNPTLLITALNDAALSHTSSVQGLVDRANEVYALLGASRALEHMTHKKGHTMTQAGLDAADEWFDRWL